MTTDVSGPGRAQHRVGHRMADGIAIGVCLESLLERDGHAAENQRAAGHQSMQVVSISYAQRGDSGREPGKVFGHREITRRRDFEVSRITVHDPDRMAGLLDEHGFVGGVSTHPHGVPQDRGAERLRRLREIDALARQRGRDRPGRVGLLDRVVRANGGNGRSCLRRRQHRATNQVVGHEWPCRVVYDDDLRPL